MTVDEKIKNYLESEEYHFSYRVPGEEGTHVFDLGFKCANSSFRVKIIYEEDYEYVDIVIPSIAYIREDNPNAKTAYALLLDFNYNQILGRFGVDESDGECSFELVFPAAGCSDEVIDRCLHVAVSTVNENYPLIMQAIFSDTPEKAFEKAREERIFRRLMRDIEQGEEEPEPETTGEPDEGRDV